MIGIFGTPLCVGRSVFRARYVIKGIVYVIHGKRFDKVCNTWIWAAVFHPNTLENVVIMTLTEPQRYHKYSYMILECDKRHYQRIPVLLCKFHQAGGHWDIFKWLFELCLCEIGKALNWRDVDL